MHSQGYFWLPFVLCAALVFPSTAVADTILITSGFLELGGSSSPFNLVGDRRGFRLFGGGFVGGSSPNAVVFCDDDPCKPGTVVEVRPAAGGLDFGVAGATLDGITHDEVNSLSGTAFAEIGFSSTHVLPPFSSTVVLRAPFTMEGSFSVVGASGFETLVGSGIVTTTWKGFASAGGPIWELAFARYDFFGPAPIPEPTTLVLAGVAGFTAAVARRRRRGR